MKTSTDGSITEYACVYGNSGQLLKPPCTERYARWCERMGANHSLLLDYSDFEESLCVVPGESSSADGNMERYF